MKQIKYNIIVVLILSLFSCNTDDIGRPGLLPTEGAIQDLTTLQSAVNSIYSRFNEKTTINFNTIFTDEVGKGYANGGQGINDPGYYFNINTTDSTVESIWAMYVVMVNYCNRVIEGGNNFVGETASEEETRLDLIAQAHALRAYAFEQLTCYYSTDIADENAVGAILFTDVPTTNTGFPRATNGAVYQLILDDLDFAEANLINESATYVVSKDFARALRIRVLAYKKDYTNIVSMVDTYFPDSELASASSYSNIWREDNNSTTENIFKLARITNGPYDYQSGWMGNNWASVDATISGSPFFEMGRSLYNEYASIPGDVRLSTFLASSSIIDPNYQNSSDYLNSDILVISKYPGVTGSQPLMNDIKVLRVSEMQLLKAEAQIANTDLVGAALTLKTLRDKRFSTPQVLPVYTNSEEAYSDLLLERRKELAFEGFRYIDIKRLGALANESFDRDPMDAGLFGAPTTLPLGSKFFTLPIPQAEMDANPSLTASDQNTGY